MPDLNLIRKPLPEQAHDMLVDLGVQFEIEPDAMPEPDPELIGTPPPEDEPSPELLPEERRNLLLDEPTGRLIEKVVEAMSDDDLRAMPVVVERKRLRDHRADWESAARGEMIEVEREEAAREQVSLENQQAEEALSSLEPGTDMAPVILDGEIVEEGEQ